MALDLATTTAESLRTVSVATARQRLADMLSVSEGSSALLLAVMSDRGLRDALLAVAVQTGRMAELREAAEWAMAEAFMTGASPYGPLAMLALTVWVEGDGEVAVSLARAVPEGDPAARMAGLVAQLAEYGVPAQGWLSRIEAIDLERCLRFHG